MPQFSVALEDNTLECYLFPLTQEAELIISKAFFPSWEEIPLSFQSFPLLRWGLICSSLHYWLFLAFLKQRERADLSPPCSRSTQKMNNFLPSCLQLILSFLSRDACSSIIFMVVDLYKGIIFTLTSFPHFLWKKRSPDSHL